MIEIGVVPSNVTIEAQELGRCDLSPVQHVEAVLHAVVVQGPRRESGRLVDAVDVHRVVVHGSPNSVRIRRVVTEGLESREAHLRALFLRGCRLRVRSIDPCCALAQVGDAPPGAEPRNQGAAPPR